LSVTLMTGIAATNVAHELMHRRNKAKVALSRVLLLFSFDLPLVLSHLYGHHVLVGTVKDHTTARRGESLYAFIWRSTVSGNLNAWRIESARFRSHGQSIWNWRNKVLHAFAGYALVSLIAGFVGGIRGAALFCLCAVVTKAILESINYIQHYGLTRPEGAKIAAHHSWNSDHAVSSWLLFNGTRHSHHHAEPEAPFWTLHSISHAPTLPFGYLISILVALVPPLWFRVMKAPLQQWDQQYRKSQIAFPGEIHAV
jgi:Fatty acid desaturase